MTTGIAVDWLDKLLGGGPYLIGGFVTCVLQSQVDHGVLQGAAHVELQREIVHALQTGGKNLQNLSIPRRLRFPHVSRLTPPSKMTAKIIPEIRVSQDDENSHTYAVCSWYILGSEQN